MTARAQMRARRVVRAMQRELWRQVGEGTLISAGQIDGNAHIVVEGRIDLAMLAYVTEAVLISEMYPTIGTGTRDGIPGQQGERV